MNEGVITLYAHWDLAWNRTPLGACSPIRMMSLNSSTTKSAFFFFLESFFFCFRITANQYSSKPHCDLGFIRILLGIRQSDSSSKDVNHEWLWWLVHPQGEKE